MPAITRRSALAIAAAVAGLVLGASAGHAQSPSGERGVAVDVGRIDVDQPLRPGQTYTLPSIGVRNPGTQASAYVMGIQDVVGPDLAVPAAWLHFAPSAFGLDPGERLRIEVTLAVPRDADTGTYQSLLTAQLAADGAGARVGAAAASRLTFTVEGAPTARVLPRWLLPAGLGLGIVVLGTGLARRYRVELVRRP